MHVIRMPQMASFKRVSLGAGVSSISLFSLMMPSCMANLTISPTIGNPGGMCAVLADQLEGR
jgi:hypothetical protein